MLNADVREKPTISIGSKITPSAFPLITNKFYSIYNMLYSLDPAFEESLIANTMTSLARSRVDSLNFYFPDVDEMTIQSFNYSHDLLMRIDHLFRYVLILFNIICYRQNNQCLNNISG